MIRKLNLACLPLLLILSACGGGGGGGSASPPTPPAPTPRVVDDTAATNQDAEVTIDVLANDTAVTASTLAVASQPTSGNATLSGNAIRYVPAAGFGGTDTFTYSVAGSTGGALTATVTITVNAAPTANADSYTLVEDTPTVLNVLDNDTDPENSLDRTASGLSIDLAPSGELTIGAGTLTYTPPLDFVGTDTFRYRVKDSAGATSNAAQVTLEVTELTTTTLTVTTLTIPQTDYTVLNNPEINANVLSSPLQALAIPPNTVSYALMLTGADVAKTDNGLLISNVALPDGTEPNPTTHRYTTCDQPLCTLSVPRRPDINAVRGQWSFRLGTQAADLTNINFSDMTLKVATRVGPKPDLNAAVPATIRVKPFIAAPQVSDAQINAILAELVAIGTANKVGITLAPLTRLTQAKYREISPDFTEATTAELVQMGDADAANIFFVESFSGAGGSGRIGIAPGIPGTLGVKSNLNGVLINATITKTAPSIYARSTAEFAFHEMGHLFGLFHTTESDFSRHDVLDDTSECVKASDDANGNGQAEISECPDGLNLMFWTIDFNETKDPLTNDQRHVLYVSPIAK